MKILLMLLVFLIEANAAGIDSSMTLVVSGETHAMINPCDCPKDPGGGFAKRAHIIQGLGDRSSLLVVDAGGFAGGGIYDSYTEGRKGDSLRTIVTLKAMRSIGYDATVIGDDDLQYGGEWLVAHAGENAVPLVSVNCTTSDGKLLAKPYILVRKGKFTFAITGITTQERLFPIDSTIRIGPPIKSLRKYWKEIVSKSDFRIILSHAGEEISRELIDSFPECSIVVNGHRKSGPNPAQMVNGRLMMEFGYLGKTLSYAKLGLSRKQMKVIKTGWLTVGPDIPEDSAVKAMIASATSNPTMSPVYDLYMMGLCPYGLDALKQITSFVKLFPTVELNIWFIGRVEKNDSLSSLHGDPEVQEELVWLAVHSLYPEKWRDFLTLRAASTTPPVLSLLQSLSIDKKKIDEWIAKKGRAELEEHYNRSVRMGIDASPTLLINNQAFDKQITFGRLAKNQCGMVLAPFCDSLPECFDDGDCRKPLKIGRCITDSGKCEFRDAARFTFTVITVDSTIQHPEDGIIATTEDLFPGVQVEKYSFTSDKGRKLIKKYNPPALPFYLFGTEVKQAHNFNTIESGLIERMGALCFKEGIVRQNYFYKRELKKGSVTLFIDPLSEALQGVAHKVFDDTMLNMVSVVPVINPERSDESKSVEEKMRVEEALRWLVLGKDYGPIKLRQYLRISSEQPGSSYWFLWLDSIHIPVKDFVSKVQNEKELLANHTTLLKQLAIHDPVSVMIDNREMLVIGNDLDFARALKGNAAR